jgi:hypothetical protein
MFLTRLAVSHVGGKRWELTDPLVWAGTNELLVIRPRFATDFASIPKPLRWLLDNAGANSEAAVLHDAIWRVTTTNPRSTRRTPTACSGERCVRRIERSRG